jgi:hypothetical protein
MVKQFSPSILRLFALGLALSLPGAVQAQTVPPCRTTAGEEGLLFEGTFSLIESPVDFEAVTSLPDHLKLFPDLRDGLAVLAIGEHGPADRAVVVFTAGGDEVHRCGVEIEKFDPNIHDRALLQSGDCTLSVVAGLPQLVMSHAQVIERPRAFEKLGVAAPDIADLATLSDRRVYLLGKMPGTTALVWAERAPSGSLDINLCPLLVASPEAGFGPDGPADDVLCQDESGAPTRLSVGQTARLVFRDANGKVREYGENLVANPEVADFSFEFGAEAGTVTGVGPGSTSLTLLTLDGETAVNCEISVE